MRNLILFATLLIALTGTASAQESSAHTKLKAENDKRRALQWYIIEPMAYCAPEGIKIVKEQGTQGLDARYGLYRARIEAATFEELFGLDPKSTDDLLPTFKQFMKLTLASDLLEVWRRGACNQSSGLTIPVR